MVNYNSLKPYLNHGIEDWGCVVSEDFKRFARLYKNMIKRLCKEKNWTLVNFNTGHYYCSWFIKNEENKFIYASFSDCRYFNTSWNKNILIRRAKNEKDFTGESNYYANLNTLDYWCEKLFEKD